MLTTLSQLLIRNLYFFQLSKTVLILTFSGSLNFAMDNSRITIFCIEDDADTRELVEFVFTSKGCHVVACGDHDCLKIAEEETFSAIILDNYFYDLNGTDICRKIRNFHPQTPIIFFSGEARQPEIAKAMKDGASAYLIKPSGFEDLVETTLRLIRNGN